MLQRLLHRDQLALALRALVVAVADVDRARLGLLGTDNCVAVLVRNPP